MADSIMTGRIYLLTTPSNEEMTDISVFLLNEAIKNKIWIIMYANMSGSGGYKYPPKNYLKEGYFPFQIVDSPWESECNRIFGGLWYEAKSFKIADISRSKLSNVEKFFEAALTNEKISNIFLEIDDTHGFPVDYTEAEIHANQFCRIIMDTPTRRDMPPLRLKIIR